MAVAFRALVGIAVALSVFWSPSLASGTEADGLEAKATELMHSGLFTEAETLARLNLERRRQETGDDTRAFARGLNLLGMILLGQGKSDAAEGAYREALGIRRILNDLETSDVADSLVLLGDLYAQSNREDEAWDFYYSAWELEKSKKRYSPPAKYVLRKFTVRDFEAGEAAKVSDRILEAIDMGATREKSQETADLLGSLGSAYHFQGRFDDAAKIYERSLALQEELLGPWHEDVALTLSNLGAVKMAVKDFKTARQYYERCLQIREHILGRNDGMTAMAYDNIGEADAAIGDFVAAEKNYQTALSINRETYHLRGVKVTLSHLGRLMFTLDKLDKAASFFEEAAYIDIEIFGELHPETASTLYDLAVVYARQEKWEDAFAFARSAAETYIERADTGEFLNPGRVLAELTTARDIFLLNVHILERWAGEEAIDEAFQLAQWAAQSEAALAVVNLTARLSSGDNVTGEVLRRYQDALSARSAVERKLAIALGSSGLEAEALSATLAEINAQLTKVGDELKATDPAFDQLFNSSPLTIEETQAALRDEEAAVLVLTMPIEIAVDYVFTWTITKDGAGWKRSRYAGRELEDAANRIRCGVDNGLRETEDGRTFCSELGVELPARKKDLATFDVDAAYLLYAQTLGLENRLLSGKRLLVVPTGIMTSIPPYALTVSQPAAPTSYSEVDWLVRHHTVVIMPSIAAISRLRGPDRTKASETADRRKYLGIGNPILDGVSESDASEKRAAIARQRCDFTALVGQLGEEETGAASPEASRGVIGSIDSDAAALKLPSLPGTADEICEVARLMGVTEDDVFLGDRATKAGLLNLESTGNLARYETVHFATHGLLPNQIGSSDAAGGEAALVLTPARTADGAPNQALLFASEVATLKLDAQMVVLSACNTAGPNGASEEALSGLARAFFYAGARSIVVSHWDVDSYASSVLIAGMIKRTSGSAGSGPAEALRSSVLEWVSTVMPKNAHPRFWAPYIVVGEGR